jgi:cytochrome b subunit of formate dehydrogenase
MHIGQSLPSNKKIKVTPHKIEKILLMLFICLILYPHQSSPQSNEDCLMCHEDVDLTMEKNGRELSIYVDHAKLSRSIHKNLSCVSCHVGFDPEEIPHKENIRPIDCKSCHADAGVKHKFHPQIMRSGGTNGGRDVSCKGCHGTHDIISPKNPNSKFARNNLAKGCGDCHKAALEEFGKSDHHIAFVNEVKGAPNCLSCHQDPMIIHKEGRDTVDVKIAQEKLCLSCHLDDAHIVSRISPTAGFITAYEKSVHGSALMKDRIVSATCIDCHNSHNIKSGNDLTSSVNRFNIPTTCGQCHSAITNDFNESIHGVSALKGNKDAPVCTDCHGEHNILKTDDPQAPVSFRNVSKEICAPCHSSVKLSDKYGIATDRYKSFADSYHGLAIRGGSVEVANCASCHGVHNIKPSSDPTSMIHKDNLVKTCGTCHPGANENFTVGRIHVTMTKEEDPILYWIATGYIALIIFIIGGMLLHNIFDFFKKAKIKKLKQSGQIIEEKHGHGLYLRMTLSERLQHGTMALSFILLVITGFMLRFPDSWWVTHIRELSSDAFEYRSLVHRIAAVAMVAVSLYHLSYISFTKRGRQLVKDLFPKYSDIQEALGVASFNLGFSKKKPKLGRFSYIEKAEYWALIWGTAIMTITGFILWFDNTFIGLLTKLGWDVARTIHYYEAWLAFLAIVVWHFYFVIFNPDVYPMNTAWLKGTISEEEMAHEHPAELEEIKRKEAEQFKKDDEISSGEISSENKPEKE